MDQELKRFLRRQSGIVQWADAPYRWMLPNAVRQGHLRRIHPHTYVDPALADHEHTRRAAALRYLADRGVLSHTTALAVWRIGWDEPASAPTHVSVPSHVRARSVKGLIVHRRSDLRLLGKHRRGGLLITSIAASLVDSWPLLASADRTGLVINAVTRRHATTRQLSDELVRQPKLTGAAELRKLLGLIEAGCHSPLELWGALHVFIGRGMPPLRRQVRVRAGGRTYILDLLAEAERVNFELDGAAFHGNTVQRERDLRRDAALATLGILVIRFSYARLVSEPDAVRLEVLAIIAARRA